MPGKLNICIKFINGCTTMPHSTSNETTNRLTSFSLSARNWGVVDDVTNEKSGSPFLMLSDLLHALFTE